MFPPLAIDLVRTIQADRLREARQERWALEAARRAPPGRLRPPPQRATAQ